MNPIRPSLTDQIVQIENEISPTLSDQLEKEVNEISPTLSDQLETEEKKNKIVEFAFRDFNKAMGVATYTTSKKLPEKYKNILPNAEVLKKLMG